eukprot:Skav233172  [mRNA]  locus=scaffold24:82012:82431:+ [translate_table: standard]
MEPSDEPDSDDLPYGPTEFMGINQPDHLQDDPSSDVTGEAPVPVDSDLEPCSPAEPAPSRSTDPQAKPVDTVSVEPDEEDIDPSQPWSESSVSELVSLKLDTKSRPSWQVISRRLKRPEADCRSKWDEVKPAKKAKTEG